MQSVQIIRAATHDADGAMAVVRTCVADMLAKGIEQWDEVYPDRSTIERDIAEETLYLAMQAGGCRGIIALDERQSNEYRAVRWESAGGKMLVVHRLAIDPAAQGQGIASRLMDFAEEHGRRNGYAGIRLDAFAGNPRALRLYNRRGYRMAGAVTFRKGLFHCFEKSLAGTEPRG